MNADSNAAPENTPEKPSSDAQQPQQATTTQTDKERGNVPQASPATPAGQGDASAPVRSAASLAALEMNRKRWANPEPPKATPMSFLKPDAARTYGDSASQPIPRERGIKGLSDLPKDWPKLPPNVSQGVEIAWVQANRLAVTKELPSGAVKVDLAKAYAPAPSMSALSWLETSIRSYAKFIEVASKQASSGQDEAEFVRKERMAIAEIDALLAEMYDAEG